METITLRDKLNIISQSCDFPPGIPTASEPNKSAHPATPLQLPPPGIHLPLLSLALSVLRVPAPSPGSSQQILRVALRELSKFLLHRLGAASFPSHL